MRLTITPNFAGNTILVDIVDVTVFECDNQVLGKSETIANCYDPIGKKAVVLLPQNFSKDAIETYMRIIRGEAVQFKSCAHALEVLKVSGFMKSPGADNTCFEYLDDYLMNNWDVDVGDLKSMQRELQPFVIPPELRHLHGCRNGKLVDSAEIAATIFHQKIMAWVKTGCPSSGREEIIGYANCMGRMKVAVSERVYCSWYYILERESATIKFLNLTVLIMDTGMFGEAYLKAIASRPVNNPKALIKLSEFLMTHPHDQDKFSFLLLCTWVKPEVLRDLECKSALNILAATLSKRSLIQLIESDDWNVFEEVATRVLVKQLEYCSILTSGTTSS